MSANPNMLARFWKEVKRRIVHRSLAIYAGTSFIILEAATIIFPRWWLPNRAIDLSQGKANAQMKLALIGLGKYDEAFEYRKKVLTYHFGEELVQSFDLIFKEEGYFAAEKEIVRQFELLAQEKYVSTSTLASRHYSNGEYSKAIDDLEKGYELHEPMLPYLAAGENGFVNLYDSARFIAIVKKMNLPLPED